MAKTVFILGAGASVESGAPLMNNFLDTAQDLLNRGSFDKNPNERHSIFEIFQLISKLESIHSRAPIDLNNIESLFGLIEMGNIIGKIGHIDDSEKIKYYRDSLITLITRTLEESMEFKINNEKYTTSSSYTSFCDYVKSYNKNNKSSIITFNYDLGVDIGLQHQFGALNYCLKKDLNDSIKLLKLHGSINWINREEGIDIIKSNVNYNNNENYIRISNRKNLTDVPVIVPPTWNKSQYHGELSNVWNSAAIELNSADNLVIIGFSIPETDTFFKYLLGLGLMNGQRIREIIVINKDDSIEIKDRYKNLFGIGINSRMKYVPLKFSDGINYLREKKDVEHFNLKIPYSFSN
jgi:hypothetical protein